MNQITKAILILILVSLSGLCWGQFDPSSVCRVEEGNITFRLDKRWSDVQKREIVSLFKLDSTIWQKIDLMPTKLFLIAPYGT
ncbi:MAG: hypothetical protein HC905_24235 [Bacteroidales bacterium]|nr:hypothetical protein [Bacteroidales bacterium]